MHKAHIRGALVGVEAVTPEGLKAIYKDFNLAGDNLVTQLQTFRRHGVHVLGSFIFGLPTDKPETFAATADVAERAGITFAQFVMLTPFPGTVDFARWEQTAEPSYVDDVPVDTVLAHPVEASGRSSSRRIRRWRLTRFRRRTQATWDAFYGLQVVWKRSSCVKSLRARLAFVIISKTIPSDVRQHGNRHRQLAPRPVGQDGAVPRQDGPRLLCRRAYAGPAGPRLDLHARGDLTEDVRSGRRSQCAPQE